MSTQSQANQDMAPKQMKELCKFDKLLHLLQADLFSIPFMQLQSAKKLDYPSLYIID